MDLYRLSLAWLGCTVVLLLIIIVGVIAYGIYNAYFHPLRRFPGPKLWAASHLPYAIDHLRGRLPFTVRDLHRQFGPVVRISPDELSFIDPEAWDDIYGLQPGRRQNRKDWRAYSPITPGADTSIILAQDDGFHAKLRRIYGTSFTPKAVEEQSGLLLKYADLLVNQLTAAVAKEPVINISKWYNYTTFDLTGMLAFGADFHCLEQGGKDHFFIDTVTGGTVTGLQMGELERYKILTLLKPFIPKSAMKPKEDIDRYTQELVDSRIERGYDPKTADVFNYLMQNKDPADAISRSELFENALVLVVAGSETTASLLTGCTYYLCKHPVEYEKLRREVRSAFQDDSQINAKTVNNLPYMQAVLLESLRTFPPSPFGIPRLITAKAGQSVAGHHVPYNTAVAIFHHAAYRSESNFARPDEFVPERWLPDAPAEFKNDRRSVLKPFMVGPRGCIGKGLAEAEMRLLLAKMVYHFDFELANPDDDWLSGLRAFMVWERDNLKIRLKPVVR